MFFKDGILLTATMFAVKLFNYAIIIFLVNSISREEYGNIVYVMSIIHFLMPFMGGGLASSFLTYNIEYNNTREFYTTCFLKGFVLSVCLVCVLFFLHPFFLKNVWVSKAYFFIIVFQIITQYVFAFAKVFYQAHYKHTSYIIIDLIHGVLNVIMCFVLIQYYGAKGYLYALVCAPLCMFLWIAYKEKLLVDISWVTALKKRLPKKIYAYGFFTACSGILYQLLIFVDILVIANIENTVSVSIYKIAVILPMSLLILGQGMMNINYVKVVNNKGENRVFIKKYIYKVFPILLCAIALLFVFDTFFLSFFDKYAYSELEVIYKIMLVGVFGAVLLRTLFHNLLYAIAKSKTSFIISLFMVILNIGLNSYFIRVYGILGAAISTASIFWISGLCYACAYYYINNKVSS